MSKSRKEFSLSATVKNISRFEDNEKHYTDIEERFNIPWRMCTVKSGAFFGLGLKCEKSNWENREWSIATNYTVKFVSQNGKSLMESEKFTFNNSNKSDVCLMKRWDLLESDYVVDDSIVVEAYVKIFNITDFPCDEDENTKTSLLSNTVRNISSIKEGDDYYTEIVTRHNIPWRLQIKRNNGFFGLFLRCEKEKDERIWVIELDYELRLVSENGQSLSFDNSACFAGPSGKGFEKFMRWNDMEEKYMINDSIVIDARVKITNLEDCDDKSSSEDEDDDFSACAIKGERQKTMSKSCKEFSLSATVKNISRFVNGEVYYTDTEERFNIPWRMFIKKNYDLFDLGLTCEKNNWENREWSIETDYTMKLVSHNGKSCMDNEEFTFENSYKSYVGLSVRSDKLESDYVVDDSIQIEAFVKIFKITDLPCDEDEDSKTFLLSNTVRNISSIEEGNCYYTEIAIRHNIPWRMQIKRKDGFFELFLRCEQEKKHERDEEIKLDYDLRLVSFNGQSLNFTGSDLLTEPWNDGFEKCIRWDDMEEKYMLNDSIIVEARVKIKEMIESEDESSSDDEEDEWGKSKSKNNSSSADLKDEISRCVIKAEWQN